VSLRTRLVKRLLRVQLAGWSEGPVSEQRARLERSSRFSRLPADVRCRHISANGVAAEWIEAGDADMGVILYLHGGAYALGSIDTHREFVARLARATSMRAHALNYRLAPEHPFPAALQDVTAAYGWLQTQGVAPSSIIVAGDSAGGGLALAALVELRNGGKPLPAGAVCISPWVDLTLSGASIQGQAQVFCILDPDSLEMYAAYYAREQDTASPLISPLFADLSGLPPLLIQVGADEILLDDAKRCADKARQAGVDVTLEIWDEMFHVFQLFPFLPETKEAVAHIAEFARGLFRYH